MESILTTLDPVIAALRPHLQPITSKLPVPVAETAQSLLGPACYRNIFEHFAPNAECASLAVSKALGLSIVGVSTIVKVPQLLKLLRSRSAAGLSFPAYLLEIASFAISLAYNARQGFPFSTYGEAAAIAAQDVLIAALILRLGGGRGAAAAATFVAGVAAAGYALSSAEIVPMPLLSRLMAGSGALAVASKLPQIYTVWQQGGTGQLSAFAVFNYLFGSASRIFTTLQEVDDKTILYNFIAGFSLNLVLALQMLYYWNSSTSAPHAAELGKGPEKIAMGQTSAFSSSAQPKVKSPTTRRRG